MPFSDDYMNPQLVEQYLTVDFKTTTGQTIKPAVKLDNHLGNDNGKFKWGGTGFYSAARNLSLSGHLLQAELQQGRKWVRANVDLSTRLRVVGGKWKYYDSDQTDEDVRDRESSPPPPYTRGTFREFREISQFSESTSRTSSFLQYKFAAEKLSLRGSILSCGSWEIDLDEYIGVVGSELIWGGRGFFKACNERASLKGYTLVTESQNQKLELNLARYLQFSSDRVSLKVTKPDEEVSRLLSEARWMKFKIVTEADAAEAAVGSKALQTAIQSLETSSKTAVTEITQELVELGSREIVDSVTDRVKAEVTRSVADSIADEVEKSLKDKIEKAFEEAKRTVFDACKDMVKEAAEQVTMSKKDSVIGPLTEEIEKQCRQTIKETIAEATETARADFQERVTVMMENEMIWATIRRAQTRAAFLEMMMMEEGVGLFSGFKPK